MKKIFAICSVFLFSMCLFSLNLSSPAFKNGSSMPSIYTCDGENISPELKISNIPPKTKSLVLIMDDPDAPVGTWVHWVVYNIPANIKILKQNIDKKPVLENGITQGKNSWGEIGYGGPCPPKITGTHRYFFKLYAIDKKLNLPPGATKKEVLKAIEGHIIAKTTLMGRYTQK